jgi:hypothetical protein
MTKGINTVGHIGVTALFTGVGRVSTGLAGRFGQDSRIIVCDLGIVGLIVLG